MNDRRTPFAARSTFAAHSVVLRTAWATCLVAAIIGGGCSSSTPGGGTGGTSAGGTNGGTGGSAGGTTGNPGLGGSTGLGGNTGTGGRGTGGSTGAGGANAGSGGRDGGTNTDGAVDAPRDSATDVALPSSTATATFSSGAVMGTAVFTQVGADVTVRVSITGCTAGAHQIFVASGFSCDSVAIEGGIWDGARGPIGANGQITCTAGTTTLNYTRTGANAATRWTVADHTATDVTTHVVIVSSANDINTRQGCANFF